MKRTKLLFASLLAFAIIFCAPQTASASKNALSEPTPDPDVTLDSRVKFTPWDIGAASRRVTARSVKPYTIMVYMNGSDLESENGMATDDIIEMLASGLDSRYANLVVFTGGTYRWMNDVIPDNKCTLWEIEGGFINMVANVGLVDMGNAGTLSSFIDFSVRNYPAEKYGLIMWDHGGGSIAGYGHDEIFNANSLTLLEMGYAFEKAGLDKNKLEFLAFDSCLMATVEMAVTAQGYAKYLVASEDLEPGEGYNYAFLAALNQNPLMDGAALGTAIVDYFMDFYGPGFDEALSLSVIDLSKAGAVMDSLGALMQRCSENLSSEGMPAFKTFAVRRGGTKTFGIGSPRDNESDMVDIGDMAHKLSDIFGDEARQVFSALHEAVVYNRHNSDVDLSGISSYYIYGGKSTAKDSLRTYSSLNVNDSYTGYLHDFASVLLGGANRGVVKGSSARGGAQVSGTQDFDYDAITGVDITAWQSSPDKEGYYIMTGIQSRAGSVNGLEINPNAYWPSISGKYVCLYEINSTANATQYAIPARRNGSDCDIVVSFNQNNPEGIILGSRREDGYIIQKGFDAIRESDTLAFYYQEKYFGDDKGRNEITWRLGDEFTVGNELALDWSKLDGDTLRYSFLMTDIQQNKQFTELRPQE